MTTAFFLVPYELIPGAKAPTRRLALHQYADLFGPDDTWAEAEIDPGQTPYGQAIARVRARPALIANIGLQLPALADPDLLWTPQRAVPRNTKGEFDFSGLEVAATKPLTRLMRDVPDDNDWDKFKRLRDYLIQKADRFGYYKLSAADFALENHAPDWYDYSLLLTECAKAGYPLNRISTGTFPTTSVLDSFTRADENPLGNGNWLGPVWSGDQQLRVSSNQCAPQTTQVWHNSYWSAAQFANCEVYATIPTVGAANDNVDLFARIASPGTANMDDYGVEVEYQATPSNNGRIIRTDNAAVTQLGALFSVDLDATEKIGFECNGSTLTAYLYQSGAWASLASRTDATYTTGYIGAELENNTARLDDFGGGTIVAATAFQKLAGPRFSLAAESGLAA